MIPLQLFKFLKYHPPKGIPDIPPIDSCIGFDTEAYSNGEPFLFCFSNGVTITDHKKLFPAFFSDELVNNNFAVWNLKYDAGAVLYHLPKESLFDLWKYGDTKYKGYRIEYIPHKCLKIFKGRAFVVFWDFCQFYQSSLNTASKNYLDKQKYELPTKSFSKSFVKKNLKKIIKYCMRDCTLTAELAAHMIKKLAEFSIYPTALYSQASISFTYFRQKIGVITVKRFWDAYPDIIKYSIDAYQGGKFECTQRGHFEKIYEYDIVSAYPYEIKNLIDITFSEVKKNKKYEPSATYGFLRCKVEITSDFCPPFGLLINNTRIYCIGQYYISMTKKEYDYLIENNISVKIISAVWLFCPYDDKPYSAIIDELFALKAKYKNKDKLLYHLTKVMMNGYYGKFVQVTEKIKRSDDSTFFQAGIGFNPIYAAIITANTRLKVTAVQNLYKNDCIAVHTDSVMLKRELTGVMAVGGLGGFEAVTDATGEAVVVACGCYQIGEQGAYKGFKPKEKPDGNLDNWKSLLPKAVARDGSYIIPYSFLRVESWVEATAKKHFDKINLFQDMPKDIDLNADIKRVWEKEIMSGMDFLEMSCTSEPRIAVETRKPPQWTL